VREAFHMLRGGLAVLMMVVRSRGGWKGAYWVWRDRTAFGEKGLVSSREKLQAVGEYLRWVSRTHSL